MIKIFKSHIGDWVKLTFAHGVEYYKIIDICDQRNEDCIIVHCQIVLCKRHAGSPKYVTRYFEKDNYCHLLLYKQHKNWYEFFTDEQMLDIFEKEFSRKNINPEEWNGNTKHSALVIQRNDLRNEITRLQFCIRITKKEISSGIEKTYSKLTALRKKLHVNEQKLKDINQKIKPSQRKFGRDWNSLKDCYNVDMYFSLIKNQLKMIKK